MAKVATDFEKIINEGKPAPSALDSLDAPLIRAGRERKKNEALAGKIFSKNRRISAPPKFTNAATGPSLASRVGIKKV